MMLIRPYPCILSAQRMFGCMCTSTEEVDQLGGDMTHTGHSNADQPLAQLCLVRACAASLHEERTGR
jgi:hypothetical protein